MKSVTEIINSTIEKMCDEYCKWPKEYTKDFDMSIDGLYKLDKMMDRLIEEKCNSCPLNNLR